MCAFKYLIRQTAFMTEFKSTKMPKMKLDAVHIFKSATWFPTEKRAGILIYVKNGENVSRSYPVFVFPSSSLRSLEQTI